MSIFRFVAELKAIDHDMNALGPAIVARACETVCAEAKRVIGEGHPYWPALSPETLARKVMNTPLLETGELRGSIEWNSSGNQGYVGSRTTRPFGRNLVYWRDLPGSPLVPPVVPVVVFLSG